MTKYYKILSLIIATLTVSCKKESSNNYELVNVDTFETRINETKNIQLIDVRTPQEYTEGYIANATNIDWNGEDFVEKINNYDKNQPIYIYCLSGGRSKKASEKLTELGFNNIIELEGGYINWSKNHPLNTVNDQYKIEEFYGIVASEPIVLVDFYAEWCGPCKKMAPFIEQFKTDYKDQVKVLKIDADKNKQLVATLGYEALPIIIIYKNSETVFEREGFVSENNLREVLNTLIN
jgi:thioredoxin 1